MDNLTVHLGSAALDSVAPTQFQSVPFLGKTIDCFLINNEVYFVVNSVIEAIGLDHSGAHSYIKNDEILSARGGYMPTPSPKYQGQKVYCLPLKYLTGWLFAIQIKKVSPEVKTVLLAFKEDAHDVLFRHYFGNITEASTSLKRNYQIDTQIKEKRAQINLLQSQNEQIQLLQSEIKQLLKEKVNITHKLPVQLGFDFELLGKEDENDGGND